MPKLQKAIAGIDLINKTKEKNITTELIEKLAIKAGTETSVEDLSGGNQQKVVLAKWFATKCKVLIMDEPTRGVDVGAKTEIYKLINTLAQQGLGIIVICSEMNELIGLCDRVVVLKDGQAQAILNNRDISEENIMKLAVGEKESDQKFT